MTTETPQEDKTPAILAYCTLVGFIVAIIMNSSNKTQIGAYHLRQSLGLFCTAIAVWFGLIALAFIPFLGFLMVFLMPIVWIFILVLVIMGIINAANGQMKPLPLVGSLYEKWFASAFV